MRGNRKLFWKEVSKVDGEKVGSCCRIKDLKGRLARGDDEVKCEGFGGIILRIFII